MLTCLKNALTVRGSFIIAILIMVIYAIHRMFKTKRTVREKILEIAVKFETEYDMISNIDPNNQSEMDAFRRIKNAYKNILTKLN